VPNKNSPAAVWSTAARAERFVNISNLKNIDGRSSTQEPGSSSKNKIMRLVILVTRPSEAGSRP
jgi:hypothetical protein